MAIIITTSSTSAGMVKEPQAWVLRFVDQVLDAAGQAHHDAGEDQQAHAVADAAVGNLLAQPHDEGGAGGQGHHGHQDEADPGFKT